MTSPCRCESIRAIPFTLNEDSQKHPACWRSGGEIYMPNAEFERVDESARRTASRSSPTHATRPPARSRTSIPRSSRSTRLQFGAHGRGEVVGLGDVKTYWES